MKTMGRRHAITKNMGGRLLFLPLNSALLLILSLCAVETDELCIPREREALLSFKGNLTDPSNRLSSWVEEPNANCCAWDGVVCHNSTGHVLQLQLSCMPPDDELLCGDKGLGGKLSPSLLDLKNLTHLDLSYNHFGWTQVPSFLGSLKSLRYLNLSRGGFSGVIPHQLGSLSNVQYLNLGGYEGFSELESCRLKSDNLEWVSGLHSLRYLDLSFADLSGATNWLQVIDAHPTLQELHFFNSFINDTASSILKPARHISSSISVVDLAGNFLYQANSPVTKWIFSLQELTSLRLSQNYFQGPIPIGLRNLTRLRQLDLSANRFNSSIPKWMFDLKHLEVLNLEINKLQETIPEGLENLTSLRTLQLSYNSLRGGIPVSIGNLTSLSTLHLQQNSLQGQIPDSIGNLMSLNFLNLGHNLLRDRIPETIGRLSSLKQLDFSFNQLSGPLPMSIGGLSSIEALYLLNNRLNGTLPESLGDLGNLRDLSLSYNELGGDVTEHHFANLSKLRRFDALANRLNLKVSPNWAPPFKLQTLVLDLSHIGPQFPRWLQSQKDLEILQMSSAGISSTLPTWFWNSFPHCYYFNLSKNAIHGKLQHIPMIPEGIVALGSNQFSGALPSISPGIVGLDLSNNSFSGSVTHLLCHEAQKLQYLNLQGNNLSGDIPNCWKNWQSLVILKFANNRLTGNIPGSIGSLTDLKSLHLRNNHLGGELPSSLGNCTSLIAVDLGENGFVGSIPIWIGKKLASIKFLSLGSNRFNGPVPAQLCALKSLQTLDLAHNELSGSIPTCFKDFTAMIIDLKNTSEAIDVFSYDYGSIMENALIVTKGITLEFNKNLGLMTSLDLSENKLSGEIPKELTRLVGLRSLNLSNNLLIGKIPETIGNMRLLESVDFSVNQIGGQIPPSFSRLTFLSHLNISNNKLMGRIPSSTQLQGFTSKSFAGNSLCGPPLSNSCDTANVRNEQHEGEGGGMEMHGIYLSLTIGFIVGFWFVSIPLLLKRSWRLSYFKYLESLWHNL